MKNFKHFFLLTIVTIFTTHMAFAQQKSFIINDTAENGTVKFRRYNISLNPQPFTKEHELLQSVLSLSKDDSLALAGSTKDSLGFTHKFYQQFYKGLKVEFGNYATHSRNGIIEIINGEFAKVGNPVVTPSISETEALSSALKYINAQQYRWQIPAEESALKILKNDTKATYYPKGELIIYYDYIHTKTYRLAFKFTISAYLPVSSSYVFVDAITGNIIGEQNLLLDGNITTTVTTKYSGLQTLTTDQYSNNGTTMYRLQNTTVTTNVNIQTFNSQRIQSTAHVDFTDVNNTWTASNNANMDNAALDAHWATEKIYDYWNIVRERNSFDNNGTPMITFVHYNEPWEILNGIPQYHTGEDNSSWDGNNHQVYLGDGYVQFTPLTSFDVCAHEFGHGFTQFARYTPLNHIYILSQNYETSETGALNEGISDIWGAVIESWATTGKQTWEIGEDIMKDGKLCLRSLSNPKTGGDPTGTAHGGYPDTYHGTYWDYNNASHTNATVMSHWFYLLSVGGSGTNDLSNSYNVTGIGITKAASIVWRAEQNYLGTNSQYSDARTVMITAATDLYCANSPEVAAVTNAWYAVGVGAAYSGNVMSISVSNLICTSAASVLQNQPAGVTFSWSTNDPANLSINSSGLATRVNNFNGDAAIYATVTGAGCSTVITENTYVGAPLRPRLFDESGNEVRTVSTCTLVYKELCPTVPIRWGVEEWDWEKVLGDFNLLDYSSCAQIFGTQPGSGLISVKVQNACGWSVPNLIVVNVTDCSMMKQNAIKMYPNPAASSVTLSVNKLGSAHPKTEADQKLPQAAINEVRIYDNFGVLKIYKKYNKQETVIIDVAGLNTGVYIVEIDFGNGVEHQQLIIKK